MHWAGMDLHLDGQAPRAGEADRRQRHIIAKVVGTISLAIFIVTVTSGTARALGVGEVVEALPIEIELGTETLPEPEPEPAEPPVEQSAPGTTGLGEVVETVTEVVTTPGSTESPAHPASQDPVASVLEPVTQVVEPVTEVVDEPVDQIARPALDPLEPLTETVADVVDSAADTVQQPLTPVTESVSLLVGVIHEPVQPVLHLVGAAVNGSIDAVENVTAPVLEGVEELLPVVPDDLIEAVDDALVGIRGPDPDPGTSYSPPVPDGQAGAPVESSRVPAEIDSPMPTVITSVRNTRNTSDPAAYSRSPAILPHAPSGITEDTGAPEGPASAALRARSGSMSSLNSPGSASPSGLLAVLVLLGLIAPRLSRWLRSRPVLWRPIALAEALEVPG